MTLLSIIALGFILGMRHATDSDHVVAVTTIVSQQRKIGSAALTGICWGIGHSMSILVIGGAICLFGLVIPERLGIGLEFCVALMLILLGLLNLRASFREASTKFWGGKSARSAFYMRLRSVIIGVVHGLAGSAAVALLLVPVIQKPVWATLYLLIFGVGTIAGMMLITGIMALPIAYSAKRFHGFSRYIGAATGALSLVFGFSLALQIGYAGSSGLSGVAWFAGVTSDRH